MLLKLPNPPRAPHDQRSSPVEWDAHKHKPHWCGVRRRARRTWPRRPRAASLAQTNFARNFPRSFFETTQKRCNSNDVNSRFELLAGELRATLLIDSHDEGAGGHRFHHVACYRWGRPPSAARAPAPPTPPSTMPATNPDQHVLSILQVGSHQLQYRLSRTNTPKSRHKTNMFCPLTLISAGGCA